MSVLVVGDFRTAHAHRFSEALADHLSPGAVEILPSWAGEVPRGCVLAPGAGPSGSSPATSARKVLLRALPTQGRLARLAFHTLVSVRAASLARRFTTPLLQRSYDVVHVLRTQPEGLGVSAALRGRRLAALALSTWGQDLVFTAQGNAFVRRRTAELLGSLDALFADNARDLRIAQSEFGLASSCIAVEMSAQVGVDPAELASYVSNSCTKPEDEIRVLVGRGVQSAYHDLYCTLEGLAGIQSQHPQLRVDIALPAHRTEVVGALRRRLRRLGLHSRTAIHAPDRRGYLQLMARAHLNLFVTHHDGLPMSMIEGMYLGALPCAVASEAYCPPLRDGENGFTIATPESDAVGDALERAIGERSRWAEMVLSGRKEVSARYTRTAQIGTLTGVYQRLLERRRA